MGLEPILTVIIFLAAEWITDIVSISTGSFAKVNACFDPAGTTAIALSLPNFHRSIRVFCASKCLQDEGCKSFSVHPSTRTCYINDVVLLDTECTDSYLHFNSDKEPPCLNGGVYNEVSNSCRCYNSYVGVKCERLMQDCNDGFVSGHYNGMKDVFTIHPTASTYPFQVFCEMEWGGELFVLRRAYDAPYVNFSRGWNDYRDGFGDISMGGNFWLGNEKIHLITTSRDHLLGIEGIMAEPPEISTWNYRQHFYHMFKVSSESNGYRFSVTYHYPKTGDHVLDDCMSNLEGIPFSTIDNDSSAGSCAGAYMSGWWFKDCSLCNPTGIIQPVSETVISSDPTSMTWPVPTNMSARFLRMFLKHKVG
ncbi:fibrinogen-like protein 1 [Haliotis rufescens]|uniref:fibrinogen-like protein 1 n=1 Tax=Haliotis rufescens TaxID=6454 RepID=UPI00201F545B|nr:fibrinogen-like protein 1 [Haliotis rufescens]